MAADQSPEGALPGQWTLTPVDDVVDPALGSHPLAMGDAGDGSLPPGFMPATTSNEPPPPPPGIAAPPPPPSAAFEPPPPPSPSAGATFEPPPPPPATPVPDAVGSQIGDLGTAAAAPAPMSVADHAAFADAPLPRPPALEVSPDAILGIGSVEEAEMLPLPAPPMSASQSTTAMLQEIHSLSASTAKEILDVSAEGGGHAYEDPADTPPISEDMTIRGRRRRSRGKFRLR